MTVWDTGKGCAAPVHTPAQAGSCDDGGPRAAGSFVELGKFQCNGNERCQHHLQGGKRGLRTAEQHVQPCHTASLISSSAQHTQSSALLTKGCFGLTALGAVTEKMPSSSGAAATLPVLYPKIHISTAQGNPKFLSHSEWRIFSFFVNYGTVS